MPPFQGRVGDNGSRQEGKGVRRRESNSKVIECM